MQNFSDIVEANGQTIRENNLQAGYAIAVGTLVETEERVRLFVVNYSRDCDGTALYDLSHDIEAQTKFKDFEDAVANGVYEDEPYGYALKLLTKGKFDGLILRGYPVESLTVA